MEEITYSLDINDYFKGNRKQKHDHDKIFLEKLPESCYDNVTKMRIILVNSFYLKIETIFENGDILETMTRTGV